MAPMLWSRMDRRLFLLASSVFGTLVTPSASFASTADEIARLLHNIPTFTLVDAEGVPYMVVGEDARVTGYFFTSYAEAARILALARGSDRANPWYQARISTVPLDVAVTLSLKSGRGALRNYFQVAPAATDILDALAVTGKEDLPEGKVPLFYMPTSESGTATRVYFQKEQLLRDYQTSVASSQEELPPVQVTELFAVLTAMVSKDDKKGIFQNIVFMAPAESEQRALECQRRQGTQPPFVLGKSNIIL